MAGSPVGQYAILGSNISDNKNFTMAGQLAANYTALTIKNAGIIIHTDPIYESATNINANAKNQFGDSERGLSQYYQEDGGYEKEEDRGSLRYLTILEGGINREQSTAKSEPSSAPLEEQNAEKA